MSDPFSDAKRVSISSDNLRNVSHQRSPQSYHRSALKSKEAPSPRPMTARHGKGSNKLSHSSSQSVDDIYEPDKSGPGGIYSCNEAQELQSDGSSVYGCDDCERAYDKAARCSKALDDPEAHREWAGKNRSRLYNVGPGDIYTSKGE